MAHRLPPRGGGGRLARQQRSEPGPRGGVGEGFILMYMRTVGPSTRPEAQGLGGLFPEAPNDMEWDEIVCSKSMQDPPKKEPGAVKI